MNTITLSPEKAYSQLVMQDTPKLTPEEYKFNVIVEGLYEYIRDKMRDLDRQRVIMHFESKLPEILRLERLYQEAKGTFLGKRKRRLLRLEAAILLGNTYRGSYYKTPLAIYNATLSDGLSHVRYPSRDTIRAKLLLHPAYDTLSFDQLVKIVSDEF